MHLANLWIRLVCFTKPCISFSLTSLSLLSRLHSNTNNWGDDRKARNYSYCQKVKHLQYGWNWQMKRKRCYATSKAKKIAWLVPVQFMSLDEFHERRLSLGESLPDFLHQLKPRYPRKPCLTQMLQCVTSYCYSYVHQFVSGLPILVSNCKPQRKSETC